MKFDPALHVAIDDIVTTNEIAKMLSTTAPAVVNWKNRFEDFPVPFKTVGGALYRQSEILAWYTKHFPERVRAARALAAIIDN